MRMQGSPAVIEALNELLTAELTVINQYFIHAKLCENWGFGRLAAKVREESMDEMRDAETLIDRIIFLDGVPNLQRLNAVGVGETVPEQFELDLAQEREAVGRYNRAIALAVAEGDNGTREILEGILRGEEDHLDWLEVQVELIAKVGLENYLSQQLYA
jgi:bacterioferritin